MVKKTITSIGVALAVAVTAASAADAPPPLLTFYPQAGILGRDLFLVNHLDLDPSPGATLDFACGHHTYDGHTGQDSGIRSFREVKIGVPVFAALDGRVLSVQFGVGGDLNWGRTVSQFDNHIILEHANGTQTVYGHLARRSIKVQRGQWVVAGTQIGLTASSGNSSGPHLHFTIRGDNGPFEPFAGPCREGTSTWAAQPTIERAAYVANVSLSARAFSGRLDLPYDEAVRTGTFVRGTRDVHVRIELRHWAGGRGTLTVTRPDGSVAASVPTAAPSYEYGWTKQRLRLDLAHVGRWTLIYAVDGAALAEAPFDVVAAPRQVRNRPPHAITASLEPSAPRPGDVVRCLVGGPLAVRDPDYGLVRYRYRWTSGGRLVRSVTTAAMSDAIPATAPRAGESLTCEVTPTDGVLRGPTASASATPGS
jgi:murein DD-endopeptidase MepM/ murein hydrolase activator NlpD